MTDKTYNSIISNTQAADILDLLIGHKDFRKIATMLQSLPMVQGEPVVCLVGMKGGAYDLPTTKRAYTYEQQPNNIAASKLGTACNAASLQSAGDNIDRGLGLLQELKKVGFGVFDLGAEFTQALTQQIGMEAADFAGWLVDHVEQEIIYEERLLGWLGKWLKHRSEAR